MEPEMTEASLMRLCEAIDGYIELGMAAEASELLALLHSEVDRWGEPACPHRRHAELLRQNVARAQDLS